MGQSESWLSGATLTVDAAPADVPRKHGLGRPWVSVRAHYGGSAPSVAGRGQAAARNRRQAKSPEERTRVLRRRGGAPGGVAVCCCLPAIREISRGLLTMRLSALRFPLISRGEKDKAQLAQPRERGTVCERASHFPLACSAQPERLWRGFGVHCDGRVTSLFWIPSRHGNRNDCYRVKWCTTSQAGFALVEGFGPQTALSAPSGVVCSG